MPPKTISDQVRAAIKESGLTRYAISRETGIDQGVLSRFMAGTTGLRMDTLDKLGVLLSLEVRARKPRRRAKR